jgi:hypothetical protein
MLSVTSSEKKLILNSTDLHFLRKLTVTIDVASFSWRATLTPIAIIDLENAFVKMDNNFNN